MWRASRHPGCFSTYLKWKPSPAMEAIAERADAARRVLMLRQAGMAQCGVGNPLLDDNIRLLSELSEQMRTCNVQALLDLIATADADAFQALFVARAYHKITWAQSA